jgi:hypothetical protein
MHDLPRRLSDKLFAAFQQACEQKNIEVAEAILKALELVLTREMAEPGKADRRAGESEPVVEAYGRLQKLKEAQKRR